MALNDRRSRLVALPTAVALLTFALAVQRWEVSVLLAVPALAATFRRRFEPGRMREAVLSAVVFAAGMFGIAPLLPEGLGQNRAVGESGPPIAIGLLGVACLRLWLRRPWSGAPLTQGLAVSAVALCGLWLQRNQYVAAMAAFLLSLAASTGREAASRPAAAGRLPLRLLAVSIALGATLLAGTAIPACHAAAYRGVTRAVRSRQSGFSERVELLRNVDIVESDRVMMRVSGPRVDYLRGVVHRRYSRGGWVPWTEELSVVAAQRLERRDPGQVEIVPQRASAVYFLPFGVRQLANEAGKVALVEGGVVHAAPGYAAATIRFRTGARDLAPVPVHPTEDLQIPEKLRPELEEIARQWAGGERDDAARLRAIERALQTRFAYSLRHQRSTSQDPVLDFLLHNRVGHCEYFATSMTLLARAMGIPARIVAGYRVSERNPVGDYWIVRARHAHSWVEAWLPGQGWTTFDPTPQSSTPALQPHQASWLGAIYDLFASGWVRERLATAAGGRWLSLLGGVAALALVAGLLRARLRPRVPRRVEPLRYGAPPEQLERLWSALRARGHDRGPAETIEQFAARLDGAGEGEAASLLRSYAGWRYGGEGDGARIVAELGAMGSKRAKGRGGAGSVAATHQAKGLGEGG